MFAKLLCAFFLFVKTFDGQRCEAPPTALIAEEDIKVYPESLSVTQADNLPLFAIQHGNDIDFTHCDDGACDSNQQRVIAANVCEGDCPMVLRTSSQDDDTVHLAYMRNFTEVYYVQCADLLCSQSQSQLVLTAYDIYGETGFNFLLDKNDSPLFFANNAIGFDMVQCGPAFNCTQLDHYTTPTMPIQAPYTFLYQQETPMLLFLTQNGSLALLVCQQQNCTSQPPSVIASPANANETFTDYSALFQPGAGIVVSYVVRTNSGDSKDLLILLSCDSTTCQAPQKRTITQADSIMSTRLRLQANGFLLLTYSSAASPLMAQFSCRSLDCTSNETTSLPINATGKISIATGGDSAYALYLDEASNLSLHRCTIRSGENAPAEITPEVRQQRRVLTLVICFSILGVLFIGTIGYNLRKVYKKKTTRKDRGCHESWHREEEKT